MQQPLLIYDGDCPFCTASSNWISTQWGSRARAVAWQTLAPHALAEYGLTPGDARDAAWWIDETGRRSRGHLAVAQALAAGSGWPAAAGRVLQVPPFRWIAGALYPLIARRRHRLPGGSPSCRM
jgi:predicted DCC family thiol-disulfide oxidoreductase YuxK